MFFVWNGTSIVVNCLVTPDSDVSGVGVRGAFYIQAAIMILLTCFKLRPDDVFFSNLSIQITSAALIGAAYFDPTIDVPHTLVASQLSVLFSACRITYHDLPTLFLRSKAATKIVSQIWVLDILFRTGLTIFNYRVWSTISSLQDQPSVCEGGFGQWTIFSTPINLSVRHPATTFAFAYCVLDIIWEVFQFVAQIVKTWAMETMSTVRSDDSALDPRFWCLQKAVLYGLRKCGCMNTIESIDFTGLSELMSVVSFFRKWIVFIFVSVAIENTIVMNGLDAVESHWSFGQIFAMANMFSLASILLSQAKPIILLTCWNTKASNISRGGLSVMYALIFLVFGIYLMVALPKRVDQISPMQQVMMILWFITPPVGAGLLYILVELAKILVELGNSTTGSPSAAIAKVCTYVFRPFGYALGILEVQTLEEV